MPVKTTQLTGKIQPDERRSYVQASHIPGRIEKLNVNYSGAFVKKGAIIGEIYSPGIGYRAGRTTGSS
ncbi:MAG: efflux RND transporter periplasmic adaptor subunit [Bacteroidales bacterium]|nr:efflux RND transporter periplasmic adaptor subunit [Bacteroidales bacterium]